MTSPLATTPAPDVQIDSGAPVVSRHEILIDAPLQVIWDLHVDVAGWPSWHSQIDGTQPRGPLAPGAVFGWQTAGLDITSTVAQLDAPHRVVWGGPAHGITGVHVWTFTDTGSGVLVRTEESWDGDPVRASVDTLQAALDASLQTWLRDLKGTAEAHAGSPSPRG
ncbi:SRPBCC family protein [Modestobacter sp. SSW1-42]|uniref:SRPBCC family protein n=1 Tax=Modestobacter sp. SSW1-42 TaxID=596372 RepID=UPI0039887439